ERPGSVARAGRRRDGAAPSARRHARRHPRGPPTLSHLAALRSSPHANSNDLIVTGTTSLGCIVCPTSMKSNSETWTPSSATTLQATSSLSLSSVPLRRIVAVAPGHLQVPVDARDERQVHLFPVDLDGVEAGLAEPAQMLQQGAGQVGGVMGRAREAGL